jgi:succinate dehydrogenase / fumarate reductase cytochrome b subunit
VYFLLRRAQSLGGIVFGGYICVHLLVNATLIQGRNPDVYQQQVDKIHSLPFLLGIEITAIYLPLLIHTLYGLYVTINGKPNNEHYGYVKNWFYLFQRITAVALVLFIFFHVGGMYGWFGETLKFDHRAASASTERHLGASWLLWLVVYPLGILFATFHMANGFYTAAISWGLTVSKKSQDRWGWICLGLFAFTFACGLISIVGAFAHHNSALPSIGERDAINVRH